MQNFNEMEIWYVYETYKIGQRVFCIYHDYAILADNVEYSGKDSFIITSLHDSWMTPDTWEWMYDAYGKWWFTTLKEAKEAVGGKIKRLAPDYYEILEEGDD